MRTFASVRHSIEHSRGPGAVYHLAANPNLWTRDRREFEAVNHQGTVNVLEAALAAGAERVLHTSTESILTRAGATGAIDEHVQISEMMPLARIACRSCGRKTPP